MLKLFGHPDSGHVFKVKFCLEVAGLEHDYEVVDIFAPLDQRSDEFRRHSRLGEVPLLRDGTQSLIQSGAILVHLARTHKILGGQSEQTLQQCLEWLYWEANRINLCLPQLRADKKFAAFRLEDEARAWLANRYKQDIQTLCQPLMDGRSFILGAEPTIADFALSGYLFYPECEELGAPSQVKAWLGRLKNLSGFKPPVELLSNG